MARRSPIKPAISRVILYLFAAYARLYLRRHLHSLRVVKGTAPRDVSEGPVIICLNHPSWFDPLVALTLARSTFKARSHYAPIDSVSLSRYKLFEHLGFFGIEPGTAKGAAHFLSTSREILRHTRSTLWITAEGSFTDVRNRPVRLRQGIGHLAHSLENVRILPLAIEYPFWEERCPEALACWGSAVEITKGSSRSPREWTDLIARQLEDAMDRLALLSRQRDKDSFEVVLAGRSGVGGAYDLWRSIKARLSGHRFVPQHGSEEF